MRRIFTNLIPAAMFGLAALPATALAHGGAHKAAEFSTMDANGDGKISADEHASGARRMFEMMDADKDGKVTADEMTAAHGKMTSKKPAAGEMSAADKIKTIDKNGDGVLTAEEHAEGAKQMFSKMDSDGDGFLSKAELTAGHEKMMKK